MAYTFYAYSVPGVGFGERVAGPVVDWAASNNKTGALLAEWNERRAGEGRPEDLQLPSTLLSSVARFGL